MSVRRLRLVLTERARNDARDIQLYTLQRWGPEQATTYEAAIDATLETLIDNPLLGRSRDTLRPGLRSFPVGKHLILYRIEDDALVVQRIVHSSQQIERALDW